LAKATTFSNWQKKRTIFFGLNKNWKLRQLEKKCFGKTGLAKRYWQKKLLAAKVIGKNGLAKVVRNPHKDTNPLKIRIFSTP